MDFSIFYQLRTKKIWWVDVVFYFVISLLISTVLCYLIFVFKIYLQKKEVKNLDAATETVGTDIQKDHEKIVFNYQKKINDYGFLVTDHKFISNIFSFLEKDTLPNVWFSKFSATAKQNKVDLSGEADNMDALSRQVATFEKNEFVKKVSLLGSNIGDLGKVNFNLGLLLDQKIFNYIPPPSSPAEAGSGGQSPSREREGGIENQLSAEKLIVSFDLPLNPEVIGVIDQTNYKITLNVPPVADLTNLSPSINVSQKAIVSPASNVPQNFTSPVIYTVTAEDGSAQNYTVTVNIAVPAKTKPSMSKTTAVATAVLAIGVIVATGLGIFFFLKKRSKKKQINMSKTSNT